MGITIEGDHEVKRLFESIAEEILPHALPGIALESAQIIEDSAKQKVPVITGQLRDSIVTEIDRENPDRVIIEIGPTEDYGDDVEFGNSRRPAKPYLRPAADEHTEAVADEMARQIEKLLGNL